MANVILNERRAEPWKTKGIALQCPNCLSLVEVTLPLDVTVEKRQNLITEAVGEHRRLCIAAAADEGRVYQISYPRI